MLDLSFNYKGYDNLKISIFSSITWINKINYNV